MRLSVLREVSPRWLDTIAAAGEIVSSRLVAAALASHGLDGAWVDARQAIVTDGEHQAAAAEVSRDDRRADAPGQSAAGRGPRAGPGRVRRRQRRRRDDDARPRRVRLLGGHRRRLPRRPRDPDLDRRRRHADRRSAHRRRAAGRAAPVVRRGVGAGLLRRQGAASGDDPAGRGPRHPGAHPQLEARRGRPARSSPPSARPAIARSPRSPRRSTSRSSTSPRRGC